MFDVKNPPPKVTPKRSLPKRQLSPSPSNAETQPEQSPKIVQEESPKREQEVSPERATVQAEGKLQAFAYIWTNDKVYNYVIKMKKVSQKVC